MISSFRSLIQHNLAAKIAALCVAVILWGYVMNDQNPAIEGSFTVRVQLKNVPEGYKIHQDTESVKIKVRGARSLFVNTAPEDFRAYADLQDASDGKHAYKVQIELPQGFEMVEARPSAVDVTLDRIIEQNVRATVHVNGAPAPGVTVAKVSQSSDTVRIEGPESVVSQVERVIGYVGLNGQNDSDFDLKVPLTAINADGREVQGVTVKPSSLYVTIQMARGLVKKIVSVQPALSDDLGKGLELVSAKADPAKIEIAGEEKVIAGINTLPTEKISLAEILNSTDKTVRLLLPDGVTVTNPNVVVHITVKAKEDSKQ